MYLSVTILIPLLILMLLSKFLFLLKIYFLTFEIPERCSAKFGAGVGRGEVESVLFSSVQPWLSR